MELSELELKECLFDKESIAVYRGCEKNSPHRSLIIKFLKYNAVDRISISRIKHEHHLLSKIESNNIIKTYGIRESKDGLLLLLEDFKATSMQQWILHHELDLLQFFNFAIEVVKGISVLHQNKIVHHDIKPHNILINEERRVKICDLGISFDELQKSSLMYSHDSLVGTLPYISPEQSGKLNCVVDHRTDFYSLGITFFEIIIKKRPFNSFDPSQLIYQHITCAPPLLHQLNPDIPVPLSNIIDKLLAKHPEDRYQKATSLLSDLHNCKDQFRKRGSIKEFPLATQDRFLNFQTTQKIYGRTKELTALEQEFTNVITNQRIRWNFIVGESGVGKSFLIKTLENKLINNNGYFVSGKFDQYHNTPYSGLVRILEEIKELLLLEDEQKLTYWKKRLRVALDGEEKVITDVAPGFKKIFDKIPPLPELASKENQIRFHGAITRFLSVFSSQKNNLIIFIDDLQWIDSASFRILKEISVSQKINALYIICSYRSNEIYPKHLVNQFKDYLKDQEIPHTTIQLKPFKLIHIQEVIADAMLVSPAESMLLAELILTRTAGVPFFVYQLLQNLYEHEQFCFQDNKWCWDLDEIKKCTITSNVVSLIVEQFNQDTLSAQSKSILQLAASVGTKFNIKQLQKYSGLDFNTIFSAIDEVNFRFIIPTTGYSYQFIHHNVREAIYGLINADDKSKKHYGIAKKILKGFQQQDEELFVLLKHFNLGRTQIKQADEIRSYSSLNYQAGCKTIQTNAFEEAVRFFSHPLDDFGEQLLKLDKHLFYLLLRKKAEAEYLAGFFEQSEESFNLALQHADSKVQKSKLYRDWTYFYTNQGRLKDAISLGIKGLKLFGIQLKNSPSNIDVFFEYLKSNWYLKGKKRESIINQFSLKDDEKKCIYELTNAIGPAAYFVDANLLKIIMMRLFKMFMTFGCHPKEGPGAIVSFGVVKGPALGDYAKGYELGTYAIELIDKLKTIDRAAEVIFLHYAFLIHWIEKNPSEISMLEKGAAIGKESGDYNYASYCLAIALLKMVVLDYPMDLILDKAEGSKKFLQKIQNYEIYDVVEGIVGSLNCLRATHGKIGSFDHQGYNEQEHIDDMIRRDSHMSRHLFYVHKVKCCYILDQFDQSIEYAFHISDTIDELLLGQIQLVEFYYYFYLALSRSIDKISAKYKAKLKKMLRRCYTKIKKWAKCSPRYFAHRFELLLAEEYRRKRHYAKAISCYQRAVQLAKREGFILNQGISYECLANSLIEAKNFDLADGIYRKALNCFQTLKMEAKVKLLEQVYERLYGLKYNNLSKDESNTKVARSIQHTATTSQYHNIDLPTILKIMQVFSDELDVQKLLPRILETAIVNSGATGGCLIFQYEDGFYVESSVFEKDSKFIYEGKVKLEDYNQVAHSVVQYVFRTQDTLVLNSAIDNNRFKKDRHINQYQIKSLIGIPFSRNNESLTAMLYLEHRWVAQVFSNEKLFCLRVLVNQAAISVQNAKLFADQEEKIYMQKELEVAQLIQKSLLPIDDNLPGIQISKHYQSADQTGGDWFYYFYEPNNNRIFIFIGDVTGHGISAALLTGSVHGAILSILNILPKLHNETDRSTQDDLLLIAQTINKTMCKSSAASDRFMTLALIGLDLKTGKCDYLNMAHDRIFHISKEEVDTYSSQGSRLGDSETPLLKPKTFQLQLDDILFLYTDGLVENRGADGKVLSAGRLRRTLKYESNIELITQKVLAQGKSIWQGFPADDDCAILVIKWVGLEAKKRVA